jgi:hypothetical protein
MGFEGLELLVFDRGSRVARWCGGRDCDDVCSGGPPSWDVEGRGRGAVVSWCGDGRDGVSGYR